MSNALVDVLLVSVTLQVLDVCRQLEQCMGYDSGWLLPGFAATRLGQRGSQQRVFLHVSPG